MGHLVQLHAGADRATAIQDLVDRVDGQQLTLHSPTEVPSGAWVAFEIRLDDETLVWEGMGKCQLCAKEGERFEVLLSDLQLDDDGELMLKRIHVEQEPEMEEVEAPRPSAPPPPPPEATKASAPPSAPPATPSAPPAPRTRPSAPPPRAKGGAGPRPSRPAPAKAKATAKAKAKAKAGASQPTPVGADPGRASSPPAPRPQEAASGMPADPVDARLARLLPTLRRLGRARDVASARTLALEVGLAALEKALEGAKS